MTETHILQAPDRLPRLYRDLAGWYPLLTPASEYAGEAAFCQGVFEIHCRRRPRTLLDLGSGGGHTASHLKAHLAVTLADLSPEMLAVSRRLNPGCEHIQGDMRSLRLGRLFDCVLIHDAVCYMTSREDLGQAVATALAHCAPGGVALFQPDYVLETFEEGTEVGGSDAEDRALRYIEWRWAPDPTDEIYLTDMAYLLRHRSGALEVVHDRHLMGLFARATWLELIAAAGFNSLALPFERGSPHAAGSEVFLGLRPGEPAGPFEMR